MNRKTKMHIAMLLIGLIILDQAVKIFINANLANKSIQIIPGVLKFTYVRNTGIAYGLGSESIILVILINLFILIALGIVWYKMRKELLTSVQLIFSIIMAGGISNLIDRVFRGYVIDYIDLNQIIDYPVFNIADIAIVLGFVAILAITMINIVKQQENIEE